MTEEQLQALMDLMSAIAWVATGDATHQPRPKGTIEHAANMVRAEFGLENLENLENRNDHD